MKKPAKLILLVCMSLLALIIIFAQYMLSREVVKFETKGVVANAIIYDKSSETTHSRRTTSTTNTLWVKALIGQDSVTSFLSDYIGNDMYAQYKIGDKVEMIYLPEDLRKSEYEMELDGKQVLKPALLALKSRLPWYYLYASICFALGLLPFLIKKKKTINN